MASQGNNRLALVKVLRGVHGFDLLAVRFELGLCQVCQRIRCLVQVLLRTEIGVAQEPTRNGLGDGPILATGKMGLLGEFHSALATKLGPHPDLVIDAPGQ